MPLYQYECAACGDGFTRLKSVARRDDAQQCLTCGEDASRVVVAAVALSCMSSSARIAASVNERSRHEPRHSTESGPCAHRADAGGSAAQVSPGGLKTFPGQRPWMISH